MNSVIVSQKSPFHFTDSSSPLKPNKLHKPQKTQINSPNKWHQNANAKGFTSKKTPQPDITQETKPKFQNPPKRQNSNKEDDEEIPREVFNRIIARVCGFVGVPMVLGYGFLSVFGAMGEQGYDVPRWVPFLTSFLTFGSSCYGIAYGALSTSWDPKRRGSLLGFEEAKEHWVEMWEEEDKSS